MLNLKGINKKKLICNIFSVFTVTLIILSSFNVDLQWYIRQSIDFIQIDTNIKSILFRYVFMFSSINNFNFIISTIVILFNMLFTISTLCVFVINFNANRHGIVEKVEYKNSSFYPQTINFASNDVYLVNGQFLC